ncbi:MAG: DUF58 domain-containing protein [Chloroflexi bacterium]|nr:DUF58 domain-containing protein [Chloroflexota bacterium]
MVVDGRIRKRADRLRRYLKMSRYFLVPVSVLVLILLGALFNDSWILYRAAYFLGLGGLFIYLWTRMNNPSSVDIRFEASSNQVQAGNAIEITLAAENSSPWPRLWLKTRLPVSIPGISMQQVVSLRGYDDRKWSFTTPILKRGLYDVGPASVSSGEVLLVHARPRVYRQTGELLVYPRTEELPYFDPFSGRNPAVNLARSAFSSSSYQVGGIRNYVYGDSIRRVHWPSSAKAGKLMVKVLDAAVSRQVWLVLDMQATVHSPEDESEECLVTAASSVAKKLIGDGLSVGLLFHGAERYVLAPGRGGDHYWNILRALAGAKAAGGVSITQLISRERTLLTQGFSVILFTPFTRPTLSSALEELRSSGCNPRVVLWEPPIPANSGETAVMAMSLRQYGMAAYRVKTGEPLARALDDSRSSGLFTPAGVAG